MCLVQVDRVPLWEIGRCDYRHFFIVRIEKRPTTNNQKFASLVGRLSSTHLFDLLDGLSHRSSLFIIIIIFFIRFFFFMFCLLKGDLGGINANGMEAGRSSWIGDCHPSSLCIISVLHSVSRVIVQFRKASFELPGPRFWHNLSLQSSRTCRHLFGFISDMRNPSIKDRDVTQNKLELIMYARKLGSGRKH